MRLFFSCVFSQEGERNVSLTTISSDQTQLGTDSTKESKELSPKPLPLSSSSPPVSKELESTSLTLNLLSGDSKGNRFQTKRARSSKPRKRSAISEANQEIFKCSECSYETRGRYQLKIHILTHSQEKLFKCAECTFSTNWKEELKAHEAKHSSKTLFHCNQCEYSTQHKYSLRHHLHKHTGLKFECSECEYKTNWKAYMKVHLQSHLKKKLLKCSQCDYETNFKSHLKTHSLKHSDGDMWKCPECSYKTYTKNLLNLHLVRHSAVKIYKCPECDYETNRRPCMKTHSLKHADKKRFNCSQCSYETNFRRQLRIHELAHSRKKLFHCSECTFSTNLKNRWMLHSLNHHTQSDGDPVGLSNRPENQEEKRDQKTYREREQILWSLDDKKTILSCFEYSRFEGWGRQKGRVLVEQIKKCSLPLEKKSTGIISKIYSMVSKMTNLFTEEERVAIKEEALKRAKDDLVTLDDGRKAEIKRSAWTLEEKWTLLWASEYARVRNIPKRDYAQSWKDLFVQLCPYKSGVSLTRLHALRYTIRKQGLFTPSQIAYMMDSVKSLLESDLSPIENPIPYSTSKELKTISPIPFNAHVSSSLEKSFKSPSIFYVSSLEKPKSFVLFEQRESNKISIDERGEAFKEK